jgi:hypothetical protein
VGLLKSAQRAEVVVLHHLWRDLHQSGLQCTNGGHVAVPAATRLHPFSLLHIVRVHPLPPGDAANKELHVANDIAHAVQRVLLAQQRRPAACTPGGCVTGSGSDSDGREGHQGLGIVVLGPSDEEVPVQP